MRRDAIRKPTDAAAARAAADGVAPKPRPQTVAGAGADRASRPAAFGVSRETVERLDRYVALLTAWQERINLVAPSTIGRHLDAACRRFAQLEPLAPHAMRWCDLGSGAGFPGLVVAIARTGPRRARRSGRKQCQESAPSCGRRSRETGVSAEPSCGRASRIAGRFLDGPTSSPPGRSPRWTSFSASSRAGSGRIARAISPRAAIMEKKSLTRRPIGVSHGKARVGDSRGSAILEIATLSAGRRDPPDADAA